MAVELAFAEPGKMFAAAEDARIAQAQQKLARIGIDLRGSADTARELITVREASNASPAPAQNRR